MQPFPPSLYKTCEEYLDAVEELLHVEERTPGTRYEHYSNEHQAWLIGVLKSGIAHVHQRIRSIGNYIFAYIMNELLAQDPEDSENYIPCMLCKKPLCTALSVVIDSCVCVKCIYRQVEEDAELTRAMHCRVMLEQIQMYKCRETVASLTMLPKDIWTDPILAKLIKGILHTSFMKAARDMQVMHMSYLNGDNCGIVLSGQYMLLGTYEDLNGPRKNVATYDIMEIDKEMQEIKPIQSLLMYCEKIKKAKPMETIVEPIIDLPDFIKRDPIEEYPTATVPYTEPPQPTKKCTLPKPSKSRKHSAKFTLQLTSIDEKTAS